MMLVFHSLHYSNEVHLRSLFKQAKLSASECRDLTISIQREQCYFIGLLVELPGCKDELFRKHEKDFAFFKTVVETLVEVIASGSSEIVNHALRALDVLFKMNRDAILNYICDARSSQLYSAMQVIERT